MSADAMTTENMLRIFGIVLKDRPLILAMQEQISTLCQMHHTQEEKIEALTQQVCKQMKKTAHDEQMDKNKAAMGLACLSVQGAVQTTAQMHEQQIKALIKQVTALTTEINKLRENQMEMEKAFIDFQGFVGLHVPSMVAMSGRRAAMSRPPATLTPAYNPFRPANLPANEEVVPALTIPSVADPTYAPLLPRFQLPTTDDHVGTEPILPLFTQHVTLLSSILVAPSRSD